jgi:YD repeat-containing protein
LSTFGIKRYHFMKTLLLSLLVFITAAGNAQYYYKDIIGTKESAEIIKAYHANNVKRVTVNSYDAEGTKDDGLFVMQEYSPTLNILKTITRSGDTDASTLTSLTDAEGKVIKTVDSSENMISTTNYKYDGSGKLISIISTSTDTAKRLNETEEHHWEYKNNQVYKMVRIVNGMDTTFVDFVLDAKGNVAEENSMRKGVKSEPVYYYYDASNRLTDIVRFNNKVRKLLPEYMFEYSTDNKVIQKITVPANSSNYTIWRYQYDAGGLKTKEAVYDKRKSLTGKIEYVYQRG